MPTIDFSQLVTAEMKAAEAAAALKAAIETRIQRHLDETAGEKGYDSGNSIASYVASTNATWAAEAEAFIAWRDQVWAYALAELDKVQAGERPAPGVDEFIGELPAMVWMT